MKKIVATVALAVVTHCMPAQDSLNNAALPAFDKIILKGASRVELKQGTGNSITSGGESLQEDVSWKIKDSNLIVSGGSSSVTITFQHISSVEVSGSSQVIGYSPVKEEYLDISVSGIGNINMNVETKNLHADISGAGKITLQGNTETLNVDISGAGKIDAADLKAINGKVDISGSGKAIVDVKENLRNDISGSGSVQLVHPPSHIEKNISGMGRVSDYNSSKSDTTRISWGKRKILIISDGDFPTVMWNDSTRHHKKVKPHWAGFELGFNGYLDANNKDALPNGYDWLDLNFGKSIAVNINFFDVGIPLYRNYIKAFTGLGLSYNNYRFRQDFTLVSGKEITHQPDSIFYTKNKLTISWLTVPAMIEFSTSEYEKKSFHLSGGMLISYKLGSHTKHVYYENGDKVKTKEFNDFNLSPFRFDLSARVGYRNFTVFATYGLNGLFNKSEGPELHPWSFGISLLAW